MPHIDKIVILFLFNQCTHFITENRSRKELDASCELIHEFHYCFPKPMSNYANYELKQYKNFLSVPNDAIR